MSDFLSGGVAVLSFIAGLFFLRFWKASKDRFFVFFGVAFWIEAVSRTLIAFSDAPLPERLPVLYMIRLTAYLLILYAILDKNRERSLGKR